MTAQCSISQFHPSEPQNGGDNSGWMSFAVTAVVFPHKGGPSNGLRSVCNRRGGTKQGSLLRVHSHISEGENHYGVEFPLRWPLPSFVIQTQGCVKSAIA